MSLPRFHGVLGFTAPEYTDNQQPTNKGETMRTLDLDLDKEFGAAELCQDDPLVREARDAGWTVYDESFDEDGIYCSRCDGSLDGSFELSGSKYSLLCVVYDPKKWTIGRYGG